MSTPFKMCVNVSHGYANNNEIKLYICKKTTVGQINAMSHMMEGSPAAIGHSYIYYQGQKCDDKKMMSSYFKWNPSKMIQLKHD